MKFRALTIAVVSHILLACSTPSPLEHKRDEARMIDLIIGTYSQDGSEGVYASSLNLDTGAIGEARLALRSTHPTFLAVSKSGVIYGAMRDPGGRVTAFRPVGTSDFTKINHQSAMGEGPCYLALSPDYRFVASANYNGGNVSVFEVGPGGMLKPNPQVRQHTGSGPNLSRQKAPHAHWVQWSPHHPELMYVIDLGIDRVMVYDFDTETGELGAAREAFASEPGDGPRHLVFHPQKPQAYIVNELSNTVSSVRVRGDGGFDLIAKASTLPVDFQGKNQAAHIAISQNAEHLYVSNRGLNSIAIFDLAEDGTMALRENVATGGDWPRFFKLLDDHGYMLVANRRSNNIKVFRVIKNGGLEATEHELTIPHPTFVDEYQR